MGLMKKILTSDEIFSGNNIKMLNALIELNKTENSVLLDTVEIRMPEETCEQLMNLGLYRKKHRRKEDRRQYKRRGK